MTLRGHAFKKIDYMMLSKFLFCNRIILRPQWTKLVLDTLLKNICFLWRWKLHLIECPLAMVNNSTSFLSMSRYMHILQAIANVMAWWDCKGRDILHLRERIWIILINQKIFLAVAIYYFFLTLTETKYSRWSGTDFSRLARRMLLRQNILV